MLAAAPKRFQDYLGARRLRLTAQRRGIVDVAFTAGQHFTADQLLTWSRARDPSVSRATVYRTLRLLTESGLLRELNLGQDRKVYDPNYADRPDHNHITCRDCGRVVEFESGELAGLAARIGHKLGFDVVDQKLHIVGSCGALRRTGYCPHRARVQDCAPAAQT